MLKGYETDQTKMTISELQEYYDLAETQNATAKVYHKFCNFRNIFHALRCVCQI